MSNPELPQDNNRLPVETNDDAILRLLGGANFGPGARLILPSGRVLSGDEAQAFTGAFADDSPEGLHTETLYTEPDFTPRSKNQEDSPLSSSHDAWTGDPQVDRQSLAMRALRALTRKRQV